MSKSDVLSFIQYCGPNRSKQMQFPAKNVPKPVIQFAYGCVDLTNDVYVSHFPRYCTPVLSGFVPVRASTTTQSAQRFAEQRFHASRGLRTGLERAVV